MERAQQEQKPPWGLKPAYSSSAAPLRKEDQKCIVKLVCYQDHHQCVATKRQGLKLGLGLLDVDTLHDLPCFYRLFILILNGLSSSPNFTSGHLLN
jgi:hypothetical protein